MSHHDHQDIADAAVARYDHVLLEHSAAFCGHQLALRVTTADAANPAKVAIHVRYDSNQTAVTLGDDGAMLSWGDTGPPFGVDNAPSTSTPSSAATEHREGESRQKQDSASVSLGQEQDSASVPLGQGQDSTSVSLGQEQDSVSVSLGREQGSVSVSLGQEQGSVRVPSGQKQGSVSVSLGQEQGGVSVSLGQEQDSVNVSLGQERDNVRVLSGQKQASTSKTVIASNIAMEHAETKSSKVTEEQSLALLVEQTNNQTKAVSFSNSVPEKKVQEEGPSVMRVITSGQDVSPTPTHQRRTPAAYLINKRAGYPRKRKLLEKSQGQLHIRDPPVRPRKMPRSAQVSPLLSAKSGMKSAAFSNQIRLPAKILQHILSFLTWQQLLRVRRVSESWRDAADACLAQYSYLHIGRFDYPAILGDVTLERLLRIMPGLRSLSVEWRLDGQKLDIDIVSQRCRNLVEIDLTRFRLDTWSLEQLCVACPGLKVVKLPRRCDDSFVEVLLRHLPHLRSLDLAHTQVTGRFLAQPNEFVEKLSLACCNSLKLEQLRMLHIFTEDASQQVICWKQLRELDLSSTAVTSADVTDVFKHFPQLERLSLARCAKLESACLLQVALCERLRDLDVSYVGCSLQASDLLAVLTKCPQLQRLVLVCCKVLEPSCLRQIDLSSVNLCLRELDVSATRGLTTADLTAILVRCPQLERLCAPDFDTVELSDYLIRLRRCTGLSELDFSRPRAPPKPPQPQPSQRALVGRIQEQEKNAEAVNVRSGFIHPSALSSLLQNCQNLQRLLLAACYIAESSSLRQLAQCSRLRELDVSSVTSLDAADLAQGLSGCMLLKRLSVAGLTAPLEQLVPPTGLPELTYLDVSRSGMTNNSLRRLRGLFPKLRTLNMRQCRAVTESGLMTYLPRLKQLRSLDLSNVSGVTQPLLNSLKGSHLGKLRFSDVRQKRERNDLNSENVAQLALGCQPLMFLDLGNSCSEVFKEVSDMINGRLSPHWAFVLCGERFRSCTSSAQPQRGPLYVVDAISVNWDEY